MKSFLVPLTRIERLNLEAHSIINDQREENQEARVHLWVDQQFYCEADQPHYQGCARMKTKVTRTMKTRKDGARYIKR